MSNTAVVIVARVGSERFPGKVLQLVEGKPYLAWLAERVSKVGPVVIATTNQPGDAAIATLGKDINVPVFRGPEHDVLLRVCEASRMLGKYEFLWPVLGDCPFIATEIAERVISVLQMQKTDAFLWLTAPHSWPVYGAREFPYRFSAFHKGCICSPVREHIDWYFHTHREEYTYTLHEPPPNLLFRQYRLELDWPADLCLIRAVAQSIGMQSSLSDVVKFLDHNPEVAALNHEHVEKTGPTITYSYETQREWSRQMQQKAVFMWDNTVWEPQPTSSSPVFCQQGSCFLGFAHKGILHTREATIRGEAHLQCACGAGRFWHEPKRTRSTDP